MNKYVFDRRSLNPAGRKDGISAFMRTKNGAQFLERAIESHIEYFDEIVAVYNGCTDGTPDILQRLAGKYPDKLRVYEYEPYVYPPASEEHKVTPADSIHAMANYSNYALSKTTCKLGVPLDDDFLAIQPNLKKAVAHIRKEGLRDTALCFSGLNLLRSSDGRVGVCHDMPFAGNKDWFFFPISEETCWSHTRRHEVLATPGLRKRYAGILTFHLKFLRSNYGLENYGLSEDHQTWQWRLLDFLRNEARSMPLEEFLLLDRQYYLRPEAPDFLQAVSANKFRTAKRIDRVIPILGLMSFFTPGDIYLARASRLKKDLEGLSIPTDL